MDTNFVHDCVTGLRVNFFSRKSTQPKEGISNKNIVYLESQFEASDLLAYTNYTFRLQAIVDFPHANYSLSKSIQSAIIRTSANCMF